MEACRDSRLLLWILLYQIDQIFQRIILLGDILHTSLTLNRKLFNEITMSILIMKCNHFGIFLYLLSIARREFILWAG